MLILTRRPGESLKIGDDIEIHVMDIKGNHVRIGIAAPDDVKVYREEIYNRIQDEDANTKEVDGNEQTKE